MELPFGKKKDELSDIPELPPLDLSQVPSGPPMTGAPQRLVAAEQANLTPGAPPTSIPMPPPAPMAPPVPMTPPTPTPPPLASPIPYPEVPAPPSPPGGSSQVTLMTQDVEKLAEDIIDEKWTKLVGEINEVKNWKDSTAKQIEDFKNSISKLDTKINDVQKAIVGKVGEYNSSLKDVNVELKAMSKVFEKIMPTFTANVKRLSLVSKPRTSAPNIITPKIKVVVPKPKKKKVTKKKKKKGRSKKKKRK